MTACGGCLDHHTPPSHTLLIFPSQVNILDKSKMDWNQLKTTDVSMESELETHKKSSNKYLEKVRCWEQRGCDCCIACMGGGSVLRGF